MTKPKAINRKKLVAFVLLIFERRLPRCRAKKMEKPNRSNTSWKRNWPQPSTRRSSWNTSWNSWPEVKEPTVFVLVPECWRSFCESRPCWRTMMWWSFYYTEFAIRSFRMYLCMIVLACINKAAFIFLQAMGRAVESTMLSMVREIVFGVGLALLSYRCFLDLTAFCIPCRCRTCWRLLSRRWW